MNVRHYGWYLAAGLVLACGLLFIIAIVGWGLPRLLQVEAMPTPDFGGTLQALVGTSPADLRASPAVTPAAPTGLSGNALGGHIVFTCQLFKAIAAEQICIMNADGSGYRRLTTEDGIRHYYPSLSPDGRSVVYSQYRQDNVYELYEMTLADGVATRITDRFGVLTAPEISPDGSLITFMRWTPASNQDQVWIMDRDGSHPRRVFDADGWDPTWSPDGNRILFASDLDGTNQLYVINLDGSGLRRVTNLPALRGRSDWSIADQIVTYSGASWQRELFMMNSDGSGVRQVGPPGGNSQGPSFSPDGTWIAFTAYFDNMHDDNGCEIYAMRTDGSELHRLTNNDYCDYQPRWGP